MNYIRNYKSIIFTFISIILLIPIIYFPISSDISIFALAGKLISNGGRIYVDYVDIKPPLYFYLFSKIYQVFGIEEISLRIFDFIIQSIIAYLIYKFNFKITKNAIIAFLSSIIYTFLYTTLNFNQTMNSEGFSGLFVLLITMLFFSDLKFKSIFIGIFTGCLIGMKYSYFLVLFSFPIYFIFNNEIKYPINIRFIISVIITSIIVVLSTFYQLIDPTIFEGYKDTIKYLSFHSSLPEININYFKFAIKSISIFLGDNLSILIVISLIVGIINYLKKYRIKNEEILDNNLSFILIILILLFLSIIFERKLSIYHFSRIYVPISIFAGMGFYKIIISIRELWKRNLAFLKILIIFSTFLIFILSPIPRYINTLIPTIYYFTDKSKYDNFYQRNNDPSFLRVTYKEVASYLNNNINSNDKVLVIAIGANQINYFLEKGTYSKFSQSSFVLGKVQIENWINDFKRELSVANWLVIQDNDYHPILNGHELSSFESFLKDEYYKKQLNDNFTQVNFIQPFRIYKRNTAEYK